MSDSLSVLFRDIHRLRRHLRDLKKEIDLLPISLKAYQSKVARQDQALKDAHEGIKKLKVTIHEKEVSLKATNQILAKYEKQANDMKTPKEVDAIQTEIANTKTHITSLEEEILAKLSELDDKTAQLPAVEEQLKKARDQAAAFEVEMAEHRTRLLAETKLAETDLKTNEAKIPAVYRSTYDRMIKAFGAEALAPVRNRSCGQCNQSVSAEQVSELSMGRFICCSNCGKLCYLVD